MLIQLVTQHPQAIPGILKGTPVWVWGLLVGLLGLGLSQVRGRVVSQQRALIVPVAMTLMALFGLVSSLSGNGQLPLALLAWLLAAVVTVTMVVRLHASAVQYDAVHRRFTLPGSWVPLAMMLCIFATKYLVGVEVALNPSALAQPDTALTVSALYGVFSGVFLARAWPLARLALQRELRAAW